METIVAEKEYSFKELEKYIFRMICNAGIAVTQQILMQKDEEIFKSVDKSIYKSEGFRNTSIKTIYGDVPFRRRLYRNTTEEGKIEYTFLLDKQLKVEKLGLMSENLVESIANLATENTYRGTAEALSENTGISISPMGAWGVMQKLGEKIITEEEYAVNQMKSGRFEGKKSIGLLFEEMDGVYIRQQGPHHEKKPMQEVKVATTYEGWDATKPNRSTLVGKKMLAGIEGSKEFHDKREAELCRHYDPDVIGQRVVNGDGGSWIGEPNDPDAIIQLDPFHVQKEIRRCIADKEAQKEIEERLQKKDIDGMLEYISIYADSVESPENSNKKAKNARVLLTYLTNNKEALIPWKERGIKIPEAPEGIEYRGMGVQENENCTLITLRMKHRRMRWSENGGNNMAKVLYRKENDELSDTIGRYSQKLILSEEIVEAVKILSAAKAPNKDGKGSRYLDRWKNHMPMLDAMVTEGRKYFRSVVG